MFRQGKCFIADNFNINLAVAQLLNAPHVCCANHELNLEVSRMVRDDVRISTVLDNLRETMVSCSNALRTSAILQNINWLRILVEINTRWSGKFTMIKRFNILRRDLIQVADRDGLVLKVDQSNQFTTKCLIYKRMLKEINDVTQLLQQRGAILGQCRSALDTFAETVRTERDDPESPLYGCRLGNRYIYRTTCIVRNPLIESFVVKIQRKQAEMMTDAERKHVCGKVRII